MAPFLRFFISTISIILLGCIPLSGEPEKSSLHLSMDRSMWKERERDILNYGGLITEDAVSGEALLLENRAFLDVSDPRVNWLGDGDFMIRFWIRMPETSAQVPWFTEPSLDGRAVFSKGIINGGISIGVEEGTFIFDASKPSVIEDSLVNVSFPKNSDGKVINDERWHWCAVSCRGRVYQFWVDGVLEHEIVLKRAIDLSNTGLLRFGADAVFHMHNFVGIVDEFWIEPEPWTDEQMLEYYERMRPKEE